MIEAFALKGELLRVRRISMEVFGDAAKLSELQADRDSAFGGAFLMVEVPVVGLEADVYQTKAKDFDRLVWEQLTPSKQPHLIVYTALYDEAV